MSRHFPSLRDEVCVVNKYYCFVGEGQQILFPPRRKMKLLRRTALSVLLVSLLIAATTFATKVYRHVNPPPIKSRATIVRPEKIAPPTLPKTAAEASARGKSAFGKLPLTFELNQGQADKQVKFLSPGKGYNLFLTGTEAALSLRKGDGAMRRNGAKKLSAHSALRTPSSALVKLQLINANPNAEVTGLDELPGKSNYFLGNDPTQWRTNVANYRQVKYAAVYPGIDQIYYGNQQQLEYDFVVAPQADPGVIKLSFDGATKMRLNKQGDLELFTPAGKVVQHRPNIYQTINGVKLTIAGHYVLQNKNQVGFVVGAYNKSQPLIIDPQLSYATFLGGSGQDNPLSIAVDPAGNAYITGITYATDFPTTPGAIKTSAYRDRQLAFVTKLNADGTALAYSTYLGSSADNSCAPDSWGQAITVDAEGNAYLGEIGRAHV